MRKKFCTPIVLSASVLIGILTWALLRPREGVYAGKPVHVWIEMLASTSPGFDLPEAWNNLGTNEMAVLIRALELRNSRLRNAYQSVHSFIWPKSRMLTRWLPTPLDTETVAINALMRMNWRDEDARAAIPAMIQIMKRDKSNSLRAMAAYELGRIGSGDQIVKDAFVTALKDNDPLVRQAAGRVLQRIDTEEARKAGATSKGP